MGWRGLEAAWAGTTWLFVPSLSCLFCGGRLASFLASAPWLPAHFRSYIPSVALNLAQQSFSVHGLLGKETPGWVSQGLRNASELPLYSPHSKSVALHCPRCVVTWACFSFGLGCSAGLKRYPSPARPSSDSLFVSLVGCLCFNLPLSHLPPPIHCPTSQGM